MVGEVAAWTAGMRMTGVEALNGLSNRCRDAFKDAANRANLGYDIVANAAGRLGETTFYTAGGAMGGLTMNDVGGWAYAALPNLEVTGATTLGDLATALGSSVGAVVLNGSSVLILEDFTNKRATAKRTVLHEILHLSMNLGDVDMADLFRIRRGDPKDNAVASAAFENWLLRDCDPSLQEGK
jgi:hypothetical protein